MSFQSDYANKKKKMSLHQIQGGAMNAAQARVCANVLYKAKLDPKRTVPLSIHTFSVKSPSPDLQNVEVRRLRRGLRATRPKARRPPAATAQSGSSE